MDKSTRNILIKWAETYNDPQYFEQDPIAFPRRFAQLYHRGEACMQDVEISALIAGHLAWGRRSMIVRDTVRAMQEMDWKPYDYVMKEKYQKNVFYADSLDFSSRDALHRTIKWGEFAAICSRLREIYLINGSVENMTADEIRTRVFASKSDLKAPNKKINLMRRWMVRDDGKVDLGLWKDTDKRDLLIPLDVHVYAQATELGLTDRKQKDIVTAKQITDSFREIFPDDPCKGDFALFGYGVTHA